MSTKKHIPPSLRYLKARLSVLAQVEVWGTALAIGGFLFIAWQYWQNPQWFNAAEETGPNADLASAFNATATNNNILSPDDMAAIGADIDSLPVLMNELNKAGAANSQNSKNQPSQEAQGLFDTMIRRQEDSKKAATPSLITTPSKEPAKESQTNPFLTPISLLGNNTLLNTANIGLPTVGRSNTSGNSSTSAGMLNNGLNPNNPNTNPPQASALETAIRNLSSPGNSSTNSSSGTPASNSPENASSPPLPGTSTSLNATSSAPANSGPNAFTYLTQPNSVPQGFSAPPATSSMPLPATPSTVPVVPPMAMPGVPITPAASANPNLGAFQPPANSTLNNSALQPSQLGSPTNPNQLNNRPAPRPYPGRAIGGGQINTFSNPSRN